jgi:hypothetical protein
MTMTTIEVTCSMISTFKNLVIPKAKPIRQMITATNDGKG